MYRKFLLALAVFCGFAVMIQAAEKNDTVNKYLGDFQGPTPALVIVQHNLTNDKSQHIHFKEMWFYCHHGALTENGDILLHHNTMIEKDINNTPHCAMISHKIIISPDGKVKGKIEILKKKRHGAINVVKKHIFTGEITSAEKGKIVITFTKEEQPKDKKDSKK